MTNTAVRNHVAARLNQAVAQGYTREEAVSLLRTGFYKTSVHSPRVATALLDALDAL